VAAEMEWQSQPISIRESEQHFAGNEELGSLGLDRHKTMRNVLALPSRFISYELAEKLAETFLTTEFEGGRHQNRVNKIACS